MGRLLQVEVKPTVWSLCMWDRKNNRVPGHFRTCQKSTASGVCGITFPLTDMAYGFPRCPTMCNVTDHKCRHTDDNRLFIEVLLMEQTLLPVTNQPAPPKKNTGGLNNSHDGLTLVPLSVHIIVPVNQHAQQDLLNEMQQSLSLMHL